MLSSSGLYTGEFWKSLRIKVQHTLSPFSSASKWGKFLLFVLLDFPFSKLWPFDVFAFALWIWEELASTSAVLPLDSEKLKYYVNSLRFFRLNKYSPHRSFFYVVLQLLPHNWGVVRLSWAHFSFPTFFFCYICKTRKNKCSFMSAKMKGRNESLCDPLLNISAQYVVKSHCCKETFLVHIPFIPQNSLILFWIASTYYLSPETSEKCSFWTSFCICVCWCSWDACGPVPSACWGPDEQIPESICVYYFREEHKNTQMCWFS